MARLKNLLLRFFFSLDREGRKTPRADIVFALGYCARAISSRGKVYRYIIPILVALVVVMNLRVWQRVCLAIFTRRGVVTDGRCIIRREREREREALKAL